MVHRVYICSNLKSPFVEKQYNQLEGCTNTNYIMSSTSCSSLFVLKQQNKFQEGEQGWMMSRTSTTTSTRDTEFESGTTQSQEGENDENIASMHMTKAQEKMEFEAQSKIESNLFTSSVRTAGQGLTKTDAQAAYGLRFGRSTWRRKAKEISFPT